MKLMRRLLVLALIASGIVVASPPAVTNAAVPSDFTLVTVLPAVKRATAFAYAPDGSIFVAEKNGIVRNYVNGVGTIWVNLKNEVNEFGGRGLDGMVLDPNFATNRRVYLFYSEELRPDDPDQAYPANGKIVRITSTATNPPVADLSTRITLLTGYDHEDNAHGIAGLAFDVGGRLLASFGDGSNTSVDPIHLVAQDLDTLYGKVIRIDPATGAGVSDNPYFNPADPTSIRSKILARGFRNPWRMSVNPNNGDVYVGDVGWATWEEINTIHPTDANPDHDNNFGWPCYEGGNGVSLKQPGFASDPVTGPMCNQLYTPAEGGTGIGAQAASYAYNHNEEINDSGSSVTAGPIYTGTTFPTQYRGKMFMGDYARGSFRVVDVTNGTATDFGGMGDFGSPVDIHQTPTGGVAFLSIVQQTIQEIVYTGANHAPVAFASANPTSGSPPLAVNFTGSNSTDADPGDTLTYSWDFGDGSALSTVADPSHTYQNAGSYTATLTVSDGHPGGIDSATIDIEVGNTPPSISYITPTASTTYKIGDTIPFSITASDPEDGTLTGASVSWDVILHHAGHVHFEANGTGTSGSYLVPDHESDDTFLEFTATATDRFGATTSATVFVLPIKVSVTLMSDPSTASIVVDGQPQTTPYTWASIPGGAHHVTAPSTMTDGTGTRAFDAWTSARTAFDTSTIDYLTPDNPLELAASYRPAIDGISIGDASVVEGDDLTRKVSFTISIPAPLASSVSVNWATVSSSASSRLDFKSASGTATIAAGSVATTVSVPVKGDTVAEPDEQFFVLLSNATGAPIADGFAIGRILDDDPHSGPQVSVGDVSVVEGDAMNRIMAFTITLSGPVSGTVSVSYTTVSGSALAGSDFTAKSGTISFSGTQRSKVINIVVRPDTISESSETFIFRLSNPSGVTISKADGIGRIIADE